MTSHDQEEGEFVRRSVTLEFIESLVIELYERSNKLSISILILYYEIYIIIIIIIIYLFLLS